MTVYYKNISQYQVFLNLRIQKIKNWLYTEFRVGNISV